MPRIKLTDDGPHLFHVELQRDRVRSFDEFPFCLPAIRALDTLKFHPKVTFFVGDNGTGKSTLLEALAIGCDLNPEGGSRNFGFKTRDSHSSLHYCLRLSKSGISPNDSYFLRAESFYNVATEVERLGVKGYGERPLHEQSHGEAFFALFEHRLNRQRGLYLMDEPEAALSPNRQLQFLSLMHDYLKRGSQFVIATHSPIIMAYPEATIYVFGTDGIKEMAYEDTEHYRVAQAFMSHRKKMLSVLLEEEK
jgi:predicted ATPase